MCNNVSLHNNCNVNERHRLTRTRRLSLSVIVKCDEVLSSVMVSILFMHCVQTCLAVLFRQLWIIYGNGKSLCDFNSGKNCST